MVRICSICRAVRTTGQGIALNLDADGAVETLQADQILIASSRRPNAEGLGLDLVDVGLAKNGGVIIDDHLRTTKQPKRFFPI